MPFRLLRRPNPLVFRPARLASRTELAPGYLRLRLAGDALRGFDSPGPDDHVRVFFPPPSAGPDPFADGDADAWRAWPSREYTPLAWDAGQGTLDLEFFLHQGSGVASSWAAQAAIGAPVAVGGPRGSVVLEGRPDVVLLAGDETAVPAMRRLLAHAGPRARGVALIEVADGARRIPIDAPPGVEVRYVERDGAVPGRRLAEALGAIGRGDRPVGAGYGFVAAEQSIVRAGRALLHERWSLDPEVTVVKGYWKRGTSEYHAPH